MKKVIISIFIILFLFLGISYFYYVHNSNVSKYINNWSIELSSNLKSLYEKKQKLDFREMELCQSVQKRSLSVFKSRGTSKYRVETLTL
jgi:hypothetical protein